MTRYDDIKRQLEASKRERKASAVHKSLAALLNSLDAWRALEVVRDHAPDAVLAYGPRTVRGDDWVGVVIWYRLKGFSGYQTLWLVGAWAQAENVLIGRKQMTFSATLYNPEAYHKLIRKDYSTYYNASSAPPDNAQIIPYDPNERLPLREALTEALLNIAY